MENTNTIVSEENRDLIYKARILYEKMNGKVKGVQDSYKENIVDTGISNDIEEKIEKDAKATKTGIKIVGTIATVALMFCPADGPFGEALTLLATPAFCALVDLAAEVKKKVLISGKRGIEKHFLKVDNANQNITGYNMENGEIVEDFVNLAKGINEVTKRGM